MPVCSMLYLSRSAGMHPMVRYRDNYVQLAEKYNVVRI